jgi:hypothetical protein
LTLQHEQFTLLCLMILFTRIDFLFNLMMIETHAYMKLIK